MKTGPAVYSDTIAPVILHAFPSAFSALSMMTSSPPLRPPPRQTQTIVKVQILLVTALWL